MNDDCLNIPPFVPDLDDKSAKIVHDLFQRLPTAVDRLLEKERHGHLRDQHGRTFLHYVAQYRQDATKNIYPKWLDRSDRNWDKLLRHFHYGIIIADAYGQTALSLAVRDPSILLDFEVIDMLSRPPCFDSINTCWTGDPISFSFDIDAGHRNEKFTWIIRFGGPRTQDLYLTAKLGGRSPPPKTILSQDILDASSLHQKDYRGRSFLFHAVGWGDEYFIRTLLLMEGVTCANSEFDGQAEPQANSPFLRAIDLCHTGIVRLFITKEPLALQNLLLWLLKEHADPTARLEKIIQMNIISNELRDSTLYLVMKLRLPSVAQLWLNDGASPKPFKFRTDWFDLWENDTWVKQAHTPVSVELEEKRVVKNGRPTKAHLLRLPEPNTQALSHNSRLIRFYQDPLPFFDELSAQMKHEYEVRLEEELEARKIICRIRLLFPNPTRFFLDLFPLLPKDMIIDLGSRSILCVKWTRWEDGGVLYESGLSAGQIPESDDVFISYLVSDFAVEWERLLEKVEERFDFHSTQYDTDGRNFILYLSAERRFLAHLRHSLHQHLKSLSGLIDNSREFYRRYFESSVNETSEDQLSETLDDQLCVKAVLHGCEKKLMERLEKQIQDIRDSIQNLAVISVGETIFMRRIGLVTFIYLPLMFAASLFGMNVNVLQNNPDWRWYILFSVAFLIFTLGLWVVSDPDFKLKNLLGKALFLFKKDSAIFYGTMRKNTGMRHQRRQSRLFGKKARLDEEASSNC